MGYFYASSAIIYCFLILATIIAFMNYNEIKNSKEWVFVPILLISILTEILASFYVWVLIKSPSFILDIYTLIIMLLTIYWFYGYLKNKIITSIAATAMIGSYVLGNYYVPDNSYELTAPVISAAIIITVLVFAFFNQLLKENNIIKYKNNRPFWLAIGLFVFHVNAMPFILFLPKVSRLSWQASLCIAFINIIMYGCFAFGLSIKNKQ